MWAQDERGKKMAQTTSSTSKNLPKNCLVSLKEHTVLRLNSFKSQFCCLAQASHSTFLDESYLPNIQRSKMILVLPYRIILRTN